MKHAWFVACGMLAAVAGGCIPEADTLSERIPEYEGLDASGLKAPTGVTATPGDQQVNVSWSPVSGAEKYNMYWRTAPGVTLDNSSSDGDVVSPYIHNGRSNGQEYCYRVNAENDIGEGPLSNEVCATPVVALIAPGAPGTLNATAGDNVVNLTWSAPTTGGAPAGYKIFRGTSPDVSTSGTPLATSFSTSHSDTTASNGSTYHYRVVAYNSVGDGPSSNEASAMPAVALVMSLAVGWYHTCVLENTGRVKCWGYNSFGQLGIGDTTARGDNPGEMGDSLSTVSLGTGLNAIDISANGYHTCVLLETDQLKCWGYNDDGRLGIGDTAPRGDNAGEMGDMLPTVDLGAGLGATSIAAGSGHACALLDTGQLKCWGNNAYGQLGLGDTLNRGDIPGEMGDILPTVDLGAGRDAMSIAAGGGHGCALLDTGQLKCWGRNIFGTLGLGDTTDRGDNLGELGDNLPAVVLGSDVSAITVAAGGDHVCALLDTGQVKCWGYNAYGQLGLGDTARRGDSLSEMGDSLPIVALGTGRNATSLAAGRFHNCALLDTGQVKCWGHNAFGQLGVGDANNRGDSPGEMGDNLPTVNLGTGRTAVEIAAGDGHSCALLDTGRVKCWGHNAFGQLGQGDTTDRGDNPGEMGDSLPVVDLGTP